MDNVSKGTVVWSRKRTKKGEATGSTHLCRLEGCSGRRITTKWPGGQITHPCSKGMNFNEDGSWEIM